MINTEKTKTLCRAFGLKIKELRLISGYTQTQIAERMGRSEIRIYQLERGNGGTVRLDTLLALAEALGVHPSELLPSQDVTEDECKVKAEQLDLFQKMNAEERAKSCPEWAKRVV